MNYRHIYHAGFFADVFKHVLLIALMESFFSKETAFLYMDSHAGIGFYDITQTAAQKTQEYKQGIGRVLAYQKPLSRWLIKYLDIIRGLNPPQLFKYYPGSPRFVRALLRSQDRMLLTELHPEDYLQLKQEFAHDKQVSVHHYDAYQALKAFLPPVKKRGLVLIDPPFENMDEFENIIEGVKIAKQRWSTASMAIWYPIKNRSKVNKFYRDLAGSGLRKILRCELTIAAVSTTSLTACGMLIIQPPWQFLQIVEQLLVELSSILGDSGEGSFKLDWLVPE